MSGPFDEDPSEPNPFGTNPFEDLGAALGPMMDMLSGTNNWEQARATAAAIANDGHSEPNVDPIVRISFEQLARVAELHVADVTGLRVSGSGSGISIEAVSRTAWTAKTIDD
jgi:hypothetical protein